MEYECYDLDLNFKLFHGDNPKLFETNDLGEACGFVYDRWKKTGIACAVYQPRTQGYREVYQPKKTDGQPRGKDGRFGRRS